MTKEQVSILEKSTAALPGMCWWSCDECPLEEKCNGAEGEVDNPPPCEKALFEAIEIVKGLCK